MSKSKHHTHNSNQLRQPQKCLRIQTPKKKMMISERNMMSSYCEQI